MTLKITRPWTLWLAVAIAAAVGAGCSRSAGPEKDKKAIQEQEEELPVAKEEVEAFNLSSFSDDGQKRWEVLGKSADLAAELIALSDITATAYGQETNVTVTAREGTFNRQARDIELRDDVRAVTTEGTTLTTETMNWNNEKQTAMTDDWTTVTRDNMVVQGQGAVGYAQLKKVRFQKQVQVDMQPATRITCAGPLVVDYERNHARFHRRVHVQDPRGEIWADRMDVRMNPKTRKLSEIQCWGHVLIQRESQQSKSQRAVYRQRDGKITLIGHPRIVFYPEQAKDAG
ncbi:MAG: LPS export ABC transporter periplasmic protein LptC [Candidatus Omnitrophica bacterium]|nr:LPS export ABC transporter periplasmic protein LptC [Candidatus Omnitrophota bacterium]